MVTVHPENRQACTFAAGSLVQTFGEISDPRDPRGVRYPLPALLALCVVAFICGRQNLTQIRRFGKAHPELLEDLGFPRPWRSPSVPTLSRVLGAVSIRELQETMARWFVGLIDSVRQRKRCRVAAVDGKTSRSAGVHVLNVFVHDIEQVVWQVPVDTKQNEITAFKQAIEDLVSSYPFLQIFTGDAMFAGEPLCSSLIEHGRHYVFQIKADQKYLYEKMDLLFAAKLNSEPAHGAFNGEKKRLRHRP